MQAFLIGFSKTSSLRHNHALALVVRPHSISKLFRGLIELGGCRQDTETRAAQCSEVRLETMAFEGLDELVEGRFREI